MKTQLRYFRTYLLLPIMLMFSAASHAALYNFSWSSAGSIPNVPGSSSVVSALIEIDALPGETFVSSDVTVLSGLLTTFGPNAGQTELNISTFNEGSISADGSSVVFTDMSFDNFGFDAFLCSGFNCFNSIVRTETSGGRVDYEFSSQQATLDSFIATLVSVPEAPTIALLLVGLSGLFNRKRTV